MALQYQVSVTPGAQRKIHDILDYLVENVSLETALKVHIAIFDTINSLSKFPEAHSVAKSISHKETVYRRVMAMSYRIVYTVKKEEIEVLVVDIDHGKRSKQHLVKKFG